MRQIPRVALALCVLAGPALTCLAVAAPSGAATRVEVRASRVTAPVALSQESLPKRTLPLQIRTRPRQPRIFPTSPTGASGAVVVVPGPGRGAGATAPGSGSSSDAPAPKPSAPKPSAPKPSTPPLSAGTPEAQALQHLNAARRDAGVAPLVLQPGLVASAHKHNVAMSKGCGLHHQCGSEAGFSARITAEGVDWSTAGENIGTGDRVAAQPAAVAAMAIRLTDMMLAEKAPHDGHRRNLLSRSFHSVGIDVYRDASGTVWLTQDFVG